MARGRWRCVIADVSCVPQGSTRRWRRSSPSSSRARPTSPVSSGRPGSTSTFASRTSTWRGCRRWPRSSTWTSSPAYSASHKSLPRKQAVREVVRGTVGLRLGWAAGTSRSYAIPPSRALRLAATPWPPSPDSREPAMGKKQGRSCINGSCVIIITRPTFRLSSVQWVQTAPAPTPRQVSAAHSSVMSSATVSRAPAVPARPAASSAHRNHPAHNQPTTRQQHDARRQEVLQEGGGGLPVRVGARCGLRSATLQRSQPDQTHSQTLSSQSSSFDKHRFVCYLLGDHLSGEQPVLQRRVALIVPRHLLLQRGGRATAAPTGPDRCGSQLRP